MAIKKETKNRLIYYEINHDEQVKLIRVSMFGNRCDSCGSKIEKVFYVPVLNWGMCEGCFRDWEQRAVRYEEDMWFSDENIRWIERVFVQVGIQLDVKC